METESKSKTQLWLIGVRESLNMSQREFANFVKISTSAVNFAEKGRNAVTFDVIAAVAHAIKRPLVECLIESGMVDPLPKLPDEIPQEFQVVLDAIDVMTPDEREGFLIYLGRIAQRAKRRKP